MRGVASAPQEIDLAQIQPSAKTNGVYLRSLRGNSNYSMMKSRLLPAVILSSTYEAGARAIRENAQWNGLVQFDIDDISEQEADAIAKLPFICWHQKSVSGRGAGFAFMHKLPEQQRKQDVTPEVYRTIWTQYALGLNDAFDLIVDSSCCDITRRRFVSDYAITYNPEARPANILMAPVSAIQEVLDPDLTGASIIYVRRSPYTESEMYSICERKNLLVPGTRNHRVYQCAFRFFMAGVPFEQAFNVISQTTSLPVEEVAAACRSARRGAQRRLAQEARQANQAAQS
jgi:VirE N-terminal domain.